jgi:hypothetical protein
VVADDKLLEVQAHTPYCYAYLGRPVTDAANLIPSTN